MIKCRDCQFRGENYLTALNGRGLYRFSFCQRLVHDCRIVDPDVERECEDFEEEVDDASTQEDASLSTKAAGDNEA